jgi:hypothetical protein
MKIARMPRKPRPRRPRQNRIDKDKCQLCHHVARHEIELALASGVQQIALARKHGLSKDVVYRHWNRHVDEARKARLLVGPVQRAALAARVDEENASVLDNLKIIRAGLYEAYDAACREGDRNSIALLSRQLHENQRIVGGITGELSRLTTVINNNQVNYYDSSEFARLRDGLKQLGKRHPIIMPALIEMLDSLETEPQPPVAIVEQRA